MWLYENKEFTSDMIGNFAGFVYEIHDLHNGMIYIGKKKFKSTRKLPPLKGKARKRTKVVESDWQDYYGSSDNVKAVLEEHGRDRFKRIIIRLCKTTAEMSYYELREQMIRDVILKPNQYYNAFVGAKVNRSHLKHLWEG